MPDNLIGIKCDDTEQWYFPRYAIFPHPSTPAPWTILMLLNGVMMLAMGILTLVRALGK